MKGLFATAIAIVAVLAVQGPAGAAAAVTDGEVVELEYWNISTVYRGDWLLVLYAPWCGHCARLQGILPGIAAQVSGVRVAKADADAEPALQVQFGVTGFPMILRLHDGEAHLHSGPRSLDDLVNFADKGWRDVPPLSKWTGPTSLLKRVLGMYAYCVLRLYAHVVTLAERIGVSAPLLAGALAAGTVVFAIILAVVCSLASGNVDLTPLKPIETVAPSSAAAASTTKKQKAGTAKKQQQRQHPPAQEQKQQQASKPAAAVAEAGSTMRQRKKQKKGAK